MCAEIGFDRWESGIGRDWVGVQSEMDTGLARKGDALRTVMVSIPSRNTQGTERRRGD